MSAPAAAAGGAARRPVLLGRRWTLPAFVLVATLFEGVLLLGWLRPLSLWRTPTNLPAGAPMVLILEQTAAGAIRFALPALILAGLWAASVRLASRLRGDGAVLLALAVSAVFLASLLPLNPGGTQDIYHNVADGRLYWLHGVNPTLVPPRAYPEDAFAQHVWGYDDLPSAYGPLWYLLTVVPTLAAGDGLVANLVAQKLLVAWFMFGTAALAALTARRIAPERAPMAVVLVGWCPLLLWETAGNGHNDGVMAFFVAAALLAAARRSYAWVLPLLTLSVLVKYTTALLVPVALVWLLRRPDVSHRQMIAGAVASAALTVLIFAPMYAGTDTVAALRRPGMTFILSPGTLLHGVFVAWLADQQATRVVQIVTGILFAGGYLASVWRTSGDLRDLAARSFDVLLLYLLLVSWWFWPWYLIWLAPAAALCRGRARPTVFAVMSVAALFTYLYWWPDPAWRSARWFLAYAAITVCVFLVPATVWLAGRPWREGRSAAPART